MERISKKQVYKLAQQLMLRLSEEEADNIIAEFDTLLKQLDLLDQIDTSNVDEMIYPFEEPTDFFREDIVDHVLPIEEVLYNAPVEEEGYFVIPKVVKD
ncbi:MAG: Asp-tRNA(Asn)/Glu-tRNA(Gln) amidotransferase subunit GatC [Erysipelotrichaceae bacterium]|nr:Asp-tRNA(Asn)/Glu-tRNA(Gln) amidotransferase subunit GatC [Erysipelotrichaceae bacterium]MDP3304910.1 Asp-tRNA(Asn)/Glu-tRNA(Gln) amidotransferase subunit GatC [Erysipelotrichaceae bacterium]